MLLATVEYVPGRELELLGIVKGTTVQSKHVGKDFMAGVKTLVGGEIIEDARRVATDRMAAEAEALGADAVIGVRYTTTSVMQGASEVVAYGTAVRYR